MKAIKLSADIVYWVTGEARRHSIKRCIFRFDYASRLTRTGSGNCTLRDWV